MSLLAQTAEARHVATQTLLQMTHLQAQMMLMIEIFFIFSARQLFD